MSLVLAALLWGGELFAPAPQTCGQNITVNAVYLAEFAAHFGEGLPVSRQFPARAFDLNVDGAINVVDLMMLTQLYGRTIVFPCGEVLTAPLGVDPPAPGQGSTLRPH